MGDVTPIAFCREPLPGAYSDSKAKTKNQNQQKAPYKVKCSNLHLFVRTD